MKNSGFQNENCGAKADFLLSELTISEKAYATFVQADIYPHKRPYFLKNHFQRAAFTRVLLDEFETLGHRTTTKTNKGANAIFEPLERQVLEGNLSDSELDTLVINREQELLILYQDLLACDLPNVTSAILQSQAEQLNNSLQALKTDLRIKTRKMG